MFDTRIPAEDFDPDTVPDGATVTATVWVDDLLFFVDPLRRPPWQGVRAEITVEDVDLFVTTGTMLSQVVDVGTWQADVESGLPEFECDEIAWNDHVGRIAWLSVNPDPDPITIAVGMDAGRSPEVLDGHHRIAAALVRQRWNEERATIDLTFDGSYEVFLSLFPDALLEIRPGESLDADPRPRLAP